MKARLVARGLSIAGVLVAVLALRVISGSHSELGRGERLLAQRDVDGAILAYRRAARWYTPGNPFSAQALDELAGIAAESERAGDLPRALAAHRAIRGAILATRSFYVPHGERLDRANDAIVRLTRGSAAGRIDPENRAAARRAAVVRALRAPPPPSVGWSVLAVLGWLAWTAAAFAFARYAIDEEDRVLAKPARLWGTMVVLGFGLFVIGMALA
jgi:hypothetical protein